MYPLPRLHFCFEAKYLRQKELNLISEYSVSD